jgi:plastocyanin
MKLTILTFIGALICMSAAKAQELTISINGIAFWPQRIVVHRGDRITWVNNDGVRHEISFSKNPTDSADRHIRYQLRPGESVSITVTKHGEYEYMCHWHGMLGTLHVD